MSSEGQEIIDRVPLLLKCPNPGFSETVNFLRKPTLFLKEIFLGGRPRPMVAITGILRRVKLMVLLSRREHLKSIQDPWPDKPTWLCAVDLDSGKRVVFGRDDVRTDVGPAVQASSAIPGRFIPVDINGKRYVDGGVHSVTNADLLAPLQLDLVIISSSSTLSSSQKNNSLSVAWNSRTLQKEIEQIRSNGTEVLTFEPTISDFSARDELESSKKAAEDIFQRSKTSAIARFSQSSI